MDEHERHYEDTLDSLRQIATSDDLRPAERSAMAAEIAEIERMLDKLEKGVVEITAFGEVNSGKSALLNALIGDRVFGVAPVAGHTTASARQDWRVDRRTFPSGLGNKLVVVDTPGINEVDGAERAAIAAETVRYSDIVLFVTFQDLTDVEYKALRELHDLHKPILLVVNKIDLFSRAQAQEMIASVRTKVGAFIPDDHIIPAAGEPRPRLRVIVGADGEEQEIEEERGPIIEELEARILEVLAREGKAVVALNANLFAAEVSERIARLKVEIRKQDADSLVEKFMWGKAVVVAVNPIPVADIVGGIATDVAMVRGLARIYGFALTEANARQLLKDVGRAWAGMGSVEYLTHIIAGMFKGATFGVGTILTAIPQGCAAAWSSYVIGQAISVYFANGGGWGDKGPKTIINRILSETTPSSVLAPIRARLTARLRGTEQPVDTTPTAQI